MKILFIAEVLTLLALQVYARNKYKVLPEMEHGGRKIYTAIFPAALLVVNGLIAGRFTVYERKLNGKLSELYGSNNIKGKALLHLANKVIAAMASVLALTFLGAVIDRPDGSYGIFSIAVIIAALYSIDKNLEDKLKMRNFSIQYDFPDFLNKLILLINAGMTVPRAWEKIVSDRTDLTPLYKELNITYQEIRNGKPELSAYEDFARRCRTKEITKFITVIIQNLRKGNGELVSLLKLQANECWQLRKNMARRLGEEASTKLVLPLMIMFIGILILVMLPAALQLKAL